MKQRIACLGCVLLLWVLLLSGCQYITGNRKEASRPDWGVSEADSEKAGALAEKESPGMIEAVHLRDKELLYPKEDETNVTVMYLTVSRGNSSENTDHSWEEINTYSAYDYDEWGVPRYQINGLLQAGDESGPLPGMLGYGEEVPNATVQIRGQTSSRYAQKNYKIELKKNKGLWEDQRTIALNKHMGDGMRFRNKLCNDLMKEIPQIMGLRTRFVHLYVKDTTGDNPEVFEDYGLYTQVEQLNRRAMKAHGLDSEGHLYKINFFEFYRYEDVIRSENDPDFDRAAFEALLEIKGNTDHSKLIRMLKDLNDYSIPGNKVLNQYFDVENLAYWMAFEILIGNVDTQNRNMYLYSPLNSDTWYILPWDHDASFMIEERNIREFTDQGSWEAGISNYWGNVLFQRALKSQKFRTELDGAIRELLEMLNEEKLTKMTRMYAEIVKPYVQSMPDQMNAKLTPEEYEQVLAAIPGEVEENYRRYLESLEKPMPFFIAVPERKGDELQFTWDASYDFDMETITYTVEVARDYLFEDVIFRAEDLILTSVSMELPESGQYFVRIRAANQSGYTQDAFDYYVTDSGKNFGMKCFYVMPDGSIEEDVYVE